MIDTHQIYKKLSKGLDPEVAETLATTLGAMYTELRETVTRADFQQLREVVQELAEAQKTTEQRLDSLTMKVGELAEAQKRTEEAIRILARELGDTRKEVGGLSNTIGYTLEDAAYRALPLLLKRDFGIEIEGRLKRGFLPDRKHVGGNIEVNILGEGTRSGKRIMIVGESKSQISKKRLLTYLDEILPRLDTGQLSPFVIVIAYMETEPGVAELARERGVALYFSYEFD